MHRNGVLVTDRPHLWQWSHRIIMTEKAEPFTLLNFLRTSIGSGGLTDKEIWYAVEELASAPLPLLICAYKHTCVLKLPSLSPIPLYFSFLIILWLSLTLFLSLLLFLISFEISVLPFSPLLFLPSLPLPLLPDICSPSLWHLLPPQHTCTVYKTLYILHRIFALSCLCLETLCYSSLQYSVEKHAVTVL